MYILYFNVMSVFGMRFSVNKCTLVTIPIIVCTYVDQASL